MPPKSVKCMDSEIKGKSGTTTALFVEYSGECRCAKCLFQDNPKKCRAAKCSPDERKDGKRGFFRAVNAKGSKYAVADGFNPLIR